MNRGEQLQTTGKDFLFTYGKTAVDTYWSTFKLGFTPKFVGELLLYFILFGLFCSIAFYLISGGKKG